MTADLSVSLFDNELFQNILPFWMNNAFDKVSGGFYGGITNNLVIHNKIPRTAVSCTRFLWTFSHAYLVTGNEDFLTIAHSTFDYLMKVFWDDTYGGLFWSVDQSGQPMRDRKHSYAQAFGIYGLSEYCKATNRTDSLDRAIELFNLVETHAFDPNFGGYFEGNARDWSHLSDSRLGESDLNCQKSMNTMIHMLEAYTNLLQISKRTSIKDQLINLLHIFLTRMISPTGHFFMFFDEDWTPLSNHMSHGHDIEGSWLMMEAAEIIGDRELKNSTINSALHLANAVLQDGIRFDKAIIHEASPEEIINPNIEWWPQAEAVVGFYNAYQMTNEKKFLTASTNSWEFINTYLVDRTYGGWIKRLLPDRSIDDKSLKAGPWEGPYHESRMCFEMIERLNKQ